MKNRKWLFFVSLILLLAGLFLPVRWFTKPNTGYFVSICLLILATIGVIIENERETKGIKSSFMTELLTTFIPMFILGILSAGLISFFKEPEYTAVKFVIDIVAATCAFLAHVILLLILLSRRKKYGIE